MKLVDVLVNLPVRALDRPFTYLVPPDLAPQVEVGSTVLVPFGRRTLAGYVIGPGDPARTGKGQLRPLEEVLESRPLWTPDLLELTHWMSRYYAALWLECLQAAVPAPVRQLGSSGGAPLASTAQLTRPPDEIPALIARLESRAPLQARCLEFLAQAGGSATVEHLVLAEGVRRTTLSGLVQKGLVCLVVGEEQAGQGGAMMITEPLVHQLTPAQGAAQEAIEAAVLQAEARTFLLHGVTGSGKTEVYLRAIAAARARGRSALVLVPEISLTPQAIERYQGRLAEPVVVLHSHLSAAERHARWWKVRRGEARVVLGARSAIFAPLEDIGIIIIDEEHEPTYKQEGSPRYHARQVAVRRARVHHCPVVLGSATPSAESYHWAMEKRYTYLSLPDRVTGHPLPEVMVVDLLEAGKEKAAGGPGDATESPQRAAPRFLEGGLLGEILVERMKDTLNHGEQVLLFLNRRGFAPYLLCGECRHVPRCPHCDISLTYHRTTRGMVCHYCAWRESAPVLCPSCGGSRLNFIGSGTQRVEEEVQSLFPTTSIARMDRDTTVERGAHARILGAFGRGEIQILLGTQMIAKGLDYPGVALVGILFADTGLFMPDFRAEERVFQVLLQAAGRSGRGARRGRVVIQTCLPDHPAVALAASQDYRTFIDRELEARKALRYPPFAHLVNLVLSGTDGNLVAAQASKLGSGLRSQDEISNRAEILGPAPCPLARLRNRHRWHLTLRGALVQDIVVKLRSYLAKFALPAGVNLAVDVDPVNLL